VAGGRPLRVAAPQLSLRCCVACRLGAPTGVACSSRANATEACSPGSPSPHPSGSRPSPRCCSCRSARRWCAGLWGDHRLVRPSHARLVAGQQQCRAPMRRRRGPTRRQHARKELGRARSASTGFPTAGRRPLQVGRIPQRAGLAAEENPRTRMSPSFTHDRGRRALFGVPTLRIFSGLAPEGRITPQGPVGTGHLAETVSRI
jgi:hypothetical protein